MNGKLKGLLLAFLICLSVVAGPFTAAVIATHGDTAGNVSAASDGTAIANATVYAYNAADGTEATNVTTDANGAYSMHLADGDYNIRVVADNYTVTEKAVTVAGATTVDFSLAASTTLKDSTFAVTDDDESVYVEIQNSTDYVTATFYGIDSAGNETQVDEVHLEANSTEFTEHRVAVDNATYDKYRVVVSGTAVETLDVGLVGKMSGGGGALITDGGFFDWTVFGIPLFAVLGLGGIAFIFRDELI